MARLFFGPGILGAIVTAFWLWALLDVILTDSMLIRNMQKGTWVFLTIFLPTVGAAAWVFFGRPEGASWVPGGAGGYSQNPYRTEDPRRYRPGSSSQASGADGSASSLGRTSEIEESLAVRERRLMEREAELARRESELESDQPEPSDDDSTT
jgi:hypothetical protein